MSRKESLGTEGKVNIVRRVLKNEISISAAGQEAGVDPKTIRRWVARYEVEGVSGFLPREQNRVYTPEKKKQAVEAYLRGEGSQQEICKRYKIRDGKTLREWITVYNAHGDFNSVKFSGGGSYMKQGRETTQEERIKIVRDCIARGKNYGEIALKYQVSYQQVRNWTIRFEEMGEAGLEDRRGKRTAQQSPRTVEEELRIKVAQLEQKLYLAEMERDLLKKLDEVERRDAFRK